MTDSGGNTVPRITQAEHIGPDGTGDNIHAKRVANYLWGGTEWSRAPLPFITASYDDVELTNPDANSNYQTMTFKSAGNTVQTVSLTYDGSSNIISIVRS
jgi:hypothetical protein